MSAEQSKAAAKISIWVMRIRRVLRDKFFKECSFTQKLLQYQKQVQ